MGGYLWLQNCDSPEMSLWVLYLISLLFFPWDCIDKAGHYHKQDQAQLQMSVTVRTSDSIVSSITVRIGIYETIFQRSR